MKNIKRLIESESSCDEIMQEVSGNKEAYDKFFQEKLDKFGVKSPADLSDDDKSKFFKEIKYEWESVSESKLTDNLITKLYNDSERILKTSPLSVLSKSADEIEDSEFDFLKLAIENFEELTNQLKKLQHKINK